MMKTKIAILWTALADVTTLNMGYNVLVVFLFCCLFCYLTVPWGKRLIRKTDKRSQSVVDLKQHVRKCAMWCVCKARLTHC